MPRGYRYTQIAFVGWLSLANAQNPRAQIKQPDAGNNQSVPVLPVVVPSAKPINPVEPAALKKPCDPSTDQRDSELCAQWKAADATRDAADWTRWGVVLGIIGTIGLFCTLYYTRKAVLAAEGATKDADSALAIACRNADAAAAQVRISEETAYRQLRAYISVEEVKIVKVLEGLVKGKIRVKNAGKTPAEIFLFVMTDLGHFPNPDPSANGPSPTRSWSHSRFINSNSLETVDWYTSTGPEHTAKLNALFADQENTAIYFYGRVEFIDYGKRKRVLNFAFRNHGPLIMDQPCEMIPCPDGNSYQDHGIQT